MREIARIKRILKLLDIVWNEYPDWRLGQLFSNLQGPGVHRDPFHVEDDEIEAALESMAVQVLTSRKK